MIRATIAIISLCAPQLLAEIVDVTLTIQPASTTTTNYEILGYGSDSGQITYTGSVTGQIDIDPESGGISAIKIDSGRATASDLNLQINIGMGFVIDIDLAGVSSSLTTNGEFIPIAMDGTLDGSGIQQTIDQGTLTVASNVPNAPSESTNYATSPTEVSPDTSGDSLKSLLLSRDQFTQEYQITHLNNVDTSTTESAEGITSTATEKGVITSAGTVEVRTPYGAWLTENSLPDAPLTSSPEGGAIPYGILYALDLTPSSTAQLPLAPNPEVQGGWILTLPDEGTLADLQIEKSPDLTSGSWEPLKTNEVSGSSSTIIAGTTGEIRFATEGNSGFFRITVLFE